jgi:hypothetical protein
MNLIVYLPYTGKILKEVFSKKLMHGNSEKFTKCNNILIYEEW